MKPFHRAFKKEKRDDKERNKIPVVDNTGRHKPYGLTAWAPVDDVYVTRFYPKPVHETAVAVDLLKSFQMLDYTPLDQPVYINLKLDMKLEKKEYSLPNHVSLWLFSGSVGVDIPKMLELFKTGHEYIVEKDTVMTRVGTLDMPKQQLIANIQTVVEDVCSHRPASLGHFIERAIVSCQTSEALLFKSEELVQKVTVKKDA
ncbi:unnamed protein product [Coregonus sp. 'balchen']|nr:unnamed protein product [Coregonus sp. 'balchen']